MYRCQKCNTVVPPNTKLNRVTVETRQKTYQVFSASGKGRRKTVNEHVGQASGFEIAKMLQCCAPCAAELADKAASISTVTPAAAAADSESLAVPLVVPATAPA